MNITPHFVFVHMPKTGGTFVSSALGALYDRVYWPSNGRVGRLFWGTKQLASQLLRRPLRHIELEKHARCQDIPPPYRQLPILGCMRNPYDWYVSNYKFAMWRTHPELHPGLLDDPRWPELSFEDYLALSSTAWLNMYNPGLTVNPTLGRLSTIFINFYCRHPQHILALPADTPDMIAQIKADMYPVTFLDTNNLNQELFDYLRQFHSPSDIDFILSKDKISPRNQRQQGETWPKFFSPAQKEAIRAKDRVLFDLFPDYDA